MSDNSGILLKKPIVFFFPYRGVGGVSTLFGSLARQLSIHHEEVYICDYQDGYMATHLNNQTTKLLIYDNSRSVDVPPNSIVIFQAMVPWNIPLNLKVDSTTTCFFWNCHPFNLIPSLPKAMGGENIWSSLSATKKMIQVLYPDGRYRIKKFLDLCIENNAISFMDGTNYRVTDFLIGVTQRPKFLPLPLPVPNKKMRSKRTSDDSISAVWIGRLVNFKYFPLLKVLNDLSKWSLQNQQKVTFHIVGTGHYKNKIKELPLSNDFFTVNFIDQIDWSKLSEFLIEECDLSFAMGLSALESARLAIPTVLLDISYNPLTNYRYKFLHESQNFILGDLIDSEIKYLSGNKNISEVMECIQQNWALESQNAYDYVLKNHSMDAILPVFETNISKSTMSLLDVQNDNCVEFPMIEKMKKSLKKLLGV